MRKEIERFSATPLTADRFHSGARFGSGKCQRLSGLIAVLALAGTVCAQEVAIKQHGFAAKIRQQKLPGGRLTAVQRQALATYSPSVSLEFTDQEIPSSVMGALSGRLYPNDAAAEAQAALQVHGAIFRRGPNDGFIFKALNTEESGAMQVRMQQTYKGIPVEGAEVLVHLSPDHVTGIAGRFVPDLDLPVDSQNRSTEAMAAAAVAFLSKEGFANPRAGQTRGPLIFLDEMSTGHVAVVVETSYEGIAGTNRVELLVDAGSGKVLNDSLVAAVSITPSAIVTGYSGNILRNPGFESGNDGNWTGNRSCVPGTTFGWLCSPDVPSITSSPTAATAHTGMYSAKLNGYGSTTQARLCQQVTMPARDIVSPQSGVMLTFYLNIVTQEIGSTAWDRLYVQIQPVPLPGPSFNLGVLNGETLTPSNKPATTPYFSNADATSNGYSQKLVPIPSNYWGRTVNVCFVGTEDYSRATSFYIDDVSLANIYSGPFLPF